MSFVGRRADSSVDAMVVAVWGLIIAAGLLGAWCIFKGLSS